MNNTLRILFAERDRDLASITKNFLISRGYSVVTCFDGEEALQIFKMESIDVVIVDINIPGIRGHDFVKEIKKQNCAVPVVCLGTDAHQPEIINGFKAGAEDFIQCPFSMEELGLRIDIICNRAVTFGKKMQKYYFGNYILDTMHTMLTFKNKELHLTPTEFELLCLFCNFKNRVVERSYALHRIWHLENFFNARNMDVYVGRLRKILCLDSEVHIDNVHGIGYKLVAP